MKVERLIMAGVLAANTGFAGYVVHAETHKPLGVTSTREITGRLDRLEEEQRQAFKWQCYEANLNRKIRMPTRESDMTIEECEKIREMGAKDAAGRPRLIPTPTKTPAPTPESIKQGIYGAGAGGEPERRGGR